MNGADWIGMWL